MKKEPEKAMLRDVEVDPYYKSCIDFEPALINDEFARLSGDLGYWNEKLADALKAELTAKMELERRESQLYLTFKEAPEGKKNPTENAVAAAIKLDKQYGELQLEYISAQYEYAQLKGRVHTIGKKGEMLISMGAQLRQEAAGDRRILERSFADRRAAQGGFNTED